MGMHIVEPVVMVVRLRGGFATRLAGAVIRFLLHWASPFTVELRAVTARANPMLVETDVYRAGLTVEIGGCLPDNAVRAPAVHPAAVVPQNDQWPDEFDFPPRDHNL